MPTSTPRHERDGRMREPDATRLSALVDAGPEAIAILDGEWRYVYVNMAFERLARTRGEHLIGRELWALAPELLGTPFEAKLRAVMHDRRATRLEFSPPRGESYDIHAMPFGDGMVFFARDITELRRATEELRQKEQRFRAILNTEPGCVMLLDRAGIVLDTNPAGLDLFEADGYDDLAGTSIADFVAPQDRDALRRAT